MSGAPPFLEEDRWSELLQRFIARGAHIRIGNTVPDMLEHVLNAIERLEEQGRLTKIPKGD